MGYMLSRAAEEDLIYIFLYGIDQFGLAQAERYHELLSKTFQFLAENPEVAHERPEITPPVRIHPVKSHLIVYTLDPDGGIFIVRVRHGREDWQHDE